MPKYIAGLAAASVILSLMAAGSAFGQTTDYTGTTVDNTGTVDMTGTIDPNTTPTTDTGTTGTPGTPDTGVPADTTTPGVPNTGAGGDAAATIMLLVISSLALLGGLGYMARERAFSA